MKQYYLIPLLLFSFIVNAQQKIIKAKIVDEFNSPIPEVNISDVHSKNGTVTDENGNFKIQIYNYEKALFKLSHIAFETKILSAKTLLETATITLESKTGQLDGVTIAKRKVDNPEEVISILSDNFLKKIRS